tara:strand:- start:681 stop:950 length:270 start_codon:yes stop_codon:yes gene_type:complete
MGKDFVEIEKVTLSELYRQYTIDHALRELRYLHPMFYNGTYSETNECQPPKPEELLDEDEFYLELNNVDSKWRDSYQVLLTYISRQNQN